MTRDRVQNALRRVHTGALHNTTIEVYEPSVTYEQGDGYTVTYPDAPTATYDARVDTPSSSQERERSGTSAEVDAVIRVRDDTGQQWTGWGEATEAPVRITDTADGVTYEVQDVNPTRDGLDELEVVEV